MQKNLILRIGMIGLLMLLLLVPLGLIRGIVGERQQLQREVEQTIASSFAGQQRIAGPVLIVPYTQRESIETTDDKGRTQLRHVDHSRYAYFLPETLVIDAAAAVDRRYKGIYQALVYHADTRLTARFELPANLGLAANPDTVRAGRPWIAMGITDLRGLAGTPAIAWNGKPLAVENGSDYDALGDGLHAVVSQLDARNAASYEMTASLSLGGSRSLAIAPIGKSTKVHMASPWRHPNFTGRFLPRTRQVADAGFDAQWEVSHLASKNAALLRQGGTARADLDTFEVAFIEPVNIYLQAERAVKYGIVFIVLTFAAFFLFEVLKDLRVHPLQYGLVGLALAVFFLLLVSLSEHLPFAIAYLSAAAASVILIAYYLAHVMGSWARGAFFGLMLTALYAVLYALMLSEDNALVLGSLLLFASLAAVMILTRNIDWYGMAATPTTTEQEA